MVSFDLLVVIAGIIYGYSKEGREDRWHMLKKGIKIGIVLGIALGILGLLMGGVMAGLAAGVVGIIALPLVAFVIALEFVIGTFIGDILERAVKK
ncbi:MAG: hypothetical protein GXO65_01445 [Euryarchaeota archaeon]|nr:hypothetical protein [Euryarchaeota archaeon]